MVPPLAARATCPITDPLFQGGMRAVIWADTFQLFIMVAGMTAVVIQGSLRVGGITNVFRIAAQGGRMNIRQ